MKRTLKVSGFVAAVSVLGVCAVGCSAEVGPDGEARDIGKSSQATQVFTPGVDLQFGGEFKISANKLLILGGYNAAGTAQTTAGIFDPTLAAGSNWLTLSSALPAALGEVEIVQLATDTYLVAGGRGSRNGTAVANSYILVLSGANKTTATWTTLSGTNDLITARVIGKNNLQKCGTSHWVAIGGITNSGMTSTTSIGATDSIEVFTYDSTTKSNSAWSTLKLASNTSKVVKLANQHGYHEVLHVSDTDFRVMGGVSTGTGTAIANVEQLLVNSDCQAIDDSVQDPAAASPLLFQLNNLPSARARMSSVKFSGSFTNGTSKTFDFIVGGGNNTTLFSATPPTDIFFYNSTADSYDSTFADLNVGRVFGRLVIDENGSTPTRVKMASGVVPDGSSTMLYNSTASVDAITNAGVVSAQTALSNSRVGSMVQTQNNVEYATFGTKYVTGTATAQTDIESF